jgi:glycosyltransferase involved in cell wall biosynthesis
MTTVLFIPYGDKNEYHNLLTDAIETEGVKTIKGETQIGLGSLEGLCGLLFPLLRYIIPYDIDVIHIVWTDVFFITTGYSRYSSIDKIVSLSRGIIFISNVVIAKVLNVRFVWTVHNKYNHEKDHIKIDVFVSRILSNFCDSITVECEQAKQTIYDLFNISNRSKIRIVPEGNYVSAYENSIDQIAARKKLDIKDEDFLFVYFGMIRPYKGVGKLIETFGTLDIDATLLVVGSPMDDDIRSEILQTS